MKVSVIIVNHNTSAVLTECVSSLYTYESPHETIIVDNCSADNSREVISKLASEHNSIKAVFLDELKSFSYANNRGADIAEGEYLLIMNPDIIFTAPVLKKLTDELIKNERIGAISPALIGKDGNFQRNYFQRYPTIRQFIYYYSFIAGLFNKSAGRMNRYLENQDIDKNIQKICFTEQIPCAFFLISKELYFAIGKLDDNYTLFFEDVDLCYRINKEHKLAVDTSVSVIHLGGSSFRSPENWNLQGLFIQSMVRFFQKNYSSIRAAILRFLVKSNSYFVLSFESVSSIIGKRDEYRTKKHRNLLNLMKSAK